MLLLRADGRTDGRTLLAAKDATDSSADDGALRLAVMFGVGRVVLWLRCSLGALRTFPRSLRRTTAGDVLARLSLMSSIDDRSVAEVIKSLAGDFAQLVRDEIALAKNEMQGSIARVGTGAGLFGGAGIVGLFAVEFLLLALMFGLIAFGVRAWLSALIVSVVLFVIGAILAVTGRKAFSHTNIVPTHTIEHVKADVAAIKADIDQARRK
jgi:uncharacterized membrane protein YqjE